MGFKCPFRHFDSEKGKEPATPGVKDLWGKPKDPDICFLQCSWEQESHWNFPKPLLTLWLPSPDIGAAHLLTAWFKDLNIFPLASQSIQSVMVPTPFALSLLLLTLSFLGLDHLPVEKPHSRPLLQVTVTTLLLALCYPKSKGPAQVIAIL